MFLLAVQDVMKYRGVNPRNTTGWRTTAQAVNGQTKAPRAVDPSEFGKAWARVKRNARKNVKETGFAKECYSI